MNLVVTLLPLLLLAVVIVGTVGLYVPLRRELARTHRALATATDQAAQERAALAKEIELLTERVGELERQPLWGPLAGLGGGDLSVGMRSRILRLNRQGEEPRQIAAALQVPRREVELTLQVQQLLRQQAPSPPSDAVPGY